MKKIKFIYRNKHLIGLIFTNCKINKAFKMKIYKVKKHNIVREVHYQVPEIMQNL